MSWSARIAHTSTGLAIVFAGPVSRLDMAPDVAQHLGSLLAIEARAAMVATVATLAGGDRQNAVLNTEWPENMPVQVIGDVHPLCCDCSLCLHGDTPLNQGYR